MRMDDLSNNVHVPSTHHLINSKEEGVNGLLSPSIISTIDASVTGDSEYQDQDIPEVLKVSNRSRPSAVAGAIAGVIRESGMAEVQSIGAGATNQAIKAVAIARSYLREEGIDIMCVPSFIDVAIDKEERTAIRLLIERR